MPQVPAKDSQPVLSAKPEQALTGANEYLWQLAEKPAAAERLRKFLSGYTK